MDLVPIYFNTTNNSLELEMGINGNEHVSYFCTDKRQTLGRYIKDFVGKVCVVKSGLFDGGVALGILEQKDAVYLREFLECMHRTGNSWYSSTNFRKLLTFTRRKENIHISKEETAFPFVRTHFKEYRDMVFLEETVKDKVVA